MIGSVSIDLSLTNIWKKWYRFKQGKRRTKELEYFQYFLEENLYQLHFDLNNGKYKHGEYYKFIVKENKRREVFVANTRDKVVHRVAYEYLVKIYDETFIFDVWSCRKNKGLVGAIERTQYFLKKYPKSYVWRSDIKKFFDSVDHRILINIILLKISDQNTLKLLREIIESYVVSASKGIPIGNLTSQIFANIYLNELDRLVKHFIKPQAYLRYGDDFILVESDRNKLILDKNITIKFLRERLALEINPKNDIIVRANKGLHFLGVEIFPAGRKLKERNWQRAKNRLNNKNIASYKGLIYKHSNQKRIKHFNWLALQKYDEF